ncbi:MAG: VTT domain-containing protein [Clostridia bacterium]|nr:VTT domain-containing protein [Clostridia bacterium]
MDNADNFLNKCRSNRGAAKIAVNILTAVFCALAALVFAVFGYSYKGLPFIAAHYALLFWLTVGILAALLLAYIIFYVLGMQAVHRLILCTLICLDVVALIFLIISATGIISKLTGIEALRDYIASFGATAVFIFILFQFLQVVVLPIPGSVSVGVGVALFGPLRCSIFSFIGIFLGSVVAFAIGRVIGYKAVCWIVGKDDLDKWLEKVKGKDYLLLSIMFLLPLFPDDILCFVAGLSSITWTYFIVMIIVTRLISVFTTSFSLQLIPFNTWWGITIWVLLGAAVIASFWLVWKYSDKIDAFVKSKFKRKNKKSK